MIKFCYSLKDFIISSNRSICSHTAGLPVVVFLKVSKSTDSHPGRIRSNLSNVSVNTQQLQQNDILSYSVHELM